MKIINSVLGKIKNRGYINNETLNYFVVNNSKIGRFYLPPRIYKRLHNIPGRPIISNSSYFTENIFSFLDFHLNPLAHKVKYYIQDTNDSLKNMANLSLFPYDLVLCAEDVVGLYLNIPHEELLIAIRRALDTRKDKTILTDSLIELAECVLKITSLNTINLSLAAQRNCNWNQNGATLCYHIYGFPRGKHSEQDSFEVFSLVTLHW